MLPYNLSWETRLFYSVIREMVRSIHFSLNTEQTVSPVWVCGKRLQLSTSQRDQTIKSYADHWSSTSQRQTTYLLMNSGQDTLPEPVYDCMSKIPVSYILVPVVYCWWGMDLWVTPVCLLLDDDVLYSNTEPSIEGSRCITLNHLG